jgi:hypothetical protein
MSTFTEVLLTAFCIAFLIKFFQFLSERQDVKNKRREQARKQPRVPHNYNQNFNH